MGENPRWISLKIVEPPRVTHYPKLVISIPKSVVRLATRRNRLKRLVREAVRHGGYVEPSGKVYWFRVRGAVPERLSLNVVASQIKSLF
ncbi:MAG: ribonuclease P protein component [Candidatus Omnitrophica bacterium]|nr:ribonuclease P protein component [Candidatus Omnitrophota bacterium]